MVAVASLVLIGAAGAAFAWYNFLRVVPQPVDGPEEYFKYGSIGTEEQGGIPYYVWRVLPRMFPEYLPRDADGNPRPGGYGALGIMWEKGQEGPVGFSRKTIGFPRIAINCAVCHTASYRTAHDQDPILVPTGPAQRFDALAYARFLSACASDERFTGDNIVREIEKDVRLSKKDRLLYKNVLVPLTRKGLLEQKAAFAWTEDGDHRDSVWGPGRIDPFNPVKFGMLGLPVDKTIGNSDMQAIWNMDQRDGQGLHWDGLNTSLLEVVVSGALGDGATNKSLPFDELKKVEHYLRKKQPPAYPYLDSVDRALADRGEELFGRHCRSCHEQGGSRVGQVIPVDEVGTDPNRLAMWTAEAASAYNQYSRKYPWDFKNFRKTNGYVAEPLDGIWLRAPYLHNGSVPTLEDLLEPADKRPRKFYRGYDVYDRDRVGFVHEGARARREGYEYDVSVPGNSNQGHEGPKYGTELPRDDKRAIVEYLKTL